MGWIASFFSGLKAEVEWLITSLAAASGNSDATADTQTADAASTAHHDDAAPVKGINIATLADQQADSAASDQHQVAQGSDPHNATSDVQLADSTAHSPANLLVNADFLVDTTDHSGPASSPGLTPISFESGGTDLSGISAIVGADTIHSDQDFHVSLPDFHYAVVHPDSGEFVLGSLGPQSSDFSKGGSGGGGNNNGGAYSGHDIISGSSGLQIDLRLDNSVYSLHTSSNPANQAEYTSITNDLQAVADFFTHTYTNPISVKINVGWGEVSNYNLSGALGESISNYVRVSPPNGTGEYQAILNAYSTLGITYHESGNPNPIAIAPIGNPYTASGELWLPTYADLKALGLTAFDTTLPTTDGSVGFASAANTWFFGGAANAANGEYDFQGVVAHEISEVLGRQTWNGVHSSGYRTFQPLDLFHFTGGTTDSAGTQIYSGTAAGYFSVDGTTDTADGYKVFNSTSSGDHSDWAVSMPADPYDWSGGLGAPTPISYADYLVMEAVGYVGNFGGTASDWPSNAIAAAI